MPFPQQGIRQSCEGVCQRCFVEQNSEKGHSYRETSLTSYNPPHVNTCPDGLYKGIQRGKLYDFDLNALLDFLKELSILFWSLSFGNYIRVQGTYAKMGISRMRDFCLSEQKKLLKTRRIITHLSDDIQGGLSYSLIRKCIGMNRSLG